MHKTREERLRRSVGRFEAEDDVLDECRCGKCDRKRDCCSNKRCPCCCCCYVRCEHVIEVIFISLVATIAISQYLFTPVTFLLAVMSRNVFGPFLLCALALVYIPIVCIRSNDFLVNDRYKLRWTRFRSATFKIALASAALLLLQNLLIVPDALNISHALAGDLDVAAERDDISFASAAFLSLAIYGGSTSTHGSYDAREFVYKSGIREPQSDYSCGWFVREWTPDLKFDLYVPEVTSASPGPFPIIFHVHGGAWRSGYKSMAAWSFEHFLDRGYAIVSSEYSFVCHGFDARDMVEDLSDALAYVRANASKWNLDADRIHMVGDSAGGHLSLLTAYQLVSSSNTSATYVRSVMNNYGPTDLASWSVWWWSGLGQRRCDDADNTSTTGGGLLYTLAGGTCEEEALELISPASQVSVRSPPTVTFIGTVDSMVPFDQATRLHDNLDAAGVKNSIVRAIACEHTPELGYYSVPAQMQRYAMKALFEKTGA